MTAGLMGQVMGRRRNWHVFRGKEAESVSVAESVLEAPSLEFGPHHPASIWDSEEAPLVRIDAVPDKRERCDANSPAQARPQRRR